MDKYIYENKNWTDFTWENAVIHSIFGEKYDGCKGKSLSR
jgi:hypothetical protein